MTSTEGAPASRAGPDVCNRGASLALAAVVAGVLSAAGLRPPEGDAPRRNGQKRRRRPARARRRRKKLNQPAATTSKVGALPALSAALASLPYGASMEEARPRAYSGFALEAEDQSPIGGMNVHNSPSRPAPGRAGLATSLGLVDAPGLLSFLNELSVTVAARPRGRSRGPRERGRATAVRPSPPPPPRECSSRRRPRVAQAIKSDVDDSDEDSKHAAVVATRCADV